MGEINHLQSILSSNNNSGGKYLEGDITNRFIDIPIASTITMSSSNIDIPALPSAHSKGFFAGILPDHAPVNNVTGHAEDIYSPMDIEVNNLIFNPIEEDD